MSPPKDSDTSAASDNENIDISSDDKNNDDTKGEDEQSGSEGESQDPENKKSRSKHGPNHAGDFPNATCTVCNVPGLKAGDDCPSEDCKGKIYPHHPANSTRQLLVFGGQASIHPTIYKFNDLQCHLCKTLFKADLPKEAVAQGVRRGSIRQYTYRFTASLLVNHYYFGRSFRSLEQITGMFGSRVADSTLNRKALEQRAFFKMLCLRMREAASNCPVLYGDDIGPKVISILPEVKKSRSGEYTYRKGIYTSIVIAITSDGRSIPIFATGLHHLGETFDQILSNRNNELPPPVIIRDQSSSNKITVCKTISSGCLQHARAYFIKAQNNYPQECRIILEKMLLIFEVDRTTHNQLPEERLETLKDKGLPIMEEILLKVEDLISAKEATPSSDMGIALNYFKNHYASLITPFEIAGVGLTNNLSEWMTYPVVRYLNNSRHYATMRLKKVLKLETM